MDNSPKTQLELDNNQETNVPNEPQENQNHGENQNTMENPNHENTISQDLN